MDKGTTDMGKMAVGCVILGTFTHLANFGRPYYDLG